MPFRVPLISDYIYYFRKLIPYTGRKFYLFLLITLVVAIFDGVGITMLFPLLKSTQMVQGGEGDIEGKADYFQKAFEFLHIPFTFQNILFVIGGIFLMKGVVVFAKSVYQGLINASLQRQLKSKMIEYYANMDYLHYARRNTGHYTNILGGQISKFIKSFTQLCNVSVQFITTLVYITIAFVLSWQFTLMAIGAGALILYFMRYLSAYSKRMSIEVSKWNRTLQKFMIQTLHSLKYLKSTARSARFLRDIRNTIHSMTSMQFKMKVASAIVTAVREPLTVLLVIGIILIQVVGLEQGLTPIIVTLLLFYRAMNTMITMQMEWQKMMNQVGGLEMVADEFEDVQTKQEQVGTEELQSFDHAIQLTNLSFAYHGTDYVLRGINMTIPKNHTVAIVGESGAGKSSLVDLLTTLNKPTKGDIQIDQITSENLYYPSWRQKIGYVPQEPVIFDDSAANNISLWQCNAHKTDCMDRIQHAAQKAYCHEFIQALPNGYHTRVGDKGIRLSGGQRQRLSIARELFKQPELMILDEATSSLDTASEKYIQQSIDELKGKMTVVIIAHRLSTIKNADYIYVLDQGEVVQEGKFDELVSVNGSKFQKMVELQSL